MGVLLGLCPVYGSCVDVTASAGGCLVVLTFFLLFRRGLFGGWVYSLFELER